VITMHGSQDMMDRLRRRLALRWALRRSAVTAAVSEDTQRYLLQRLRLPPAAIRLIRNGIPHRPGDARRIRQELRLAEGEPLILSVGNLIPRKGHIVLLRALASLGDDGTERAWRLAIAGGGPEREPLEEFSASHGLAGRVHLLGPRNDIPDLQAAASIFVMPSLWEGLPLAVLEAMFAGSAIIASKTSGIPEAITDGVDGVLLPPGDPAALAAALRTVLDSPGRRQELGAAARRRADAAFSIRIMADAYEAVYRALSVAW
jgi:glycosyltransferase involved in cell wall biosynthesis